MGQWDNEAVKILSRTLAAIVLFAATPAAAQEPLPWEIWRDLAELARIRFDHQVVLRSSRCPDGCRYDRHSDGDSRFIRTIGDEGVIFETEGAGAITRIWMTQGESGISVPLDPEISIRVTLDGAATPVIDLPLPDFFGSHPPFEPPVAVDRLTASGGNINVVPIPFRDGCRVSLVGAEAERIWFQVNAHRLPSPDGVVSFTGGEDLSDWRALLAATGTDPWIDGASHPTVAGSTILDPGGETVIGSLVGPDTLTALRFDLDPARWDEVELVLDFDGVERTELGLRDFFAVGRAASEPTRSMLVGSDDSDTLYSYFPMPFFRAATVALRLDECAAAPVEIDHEIRRRNQPPAADSGLFGARLRVIESSTPGVDSPIVELGGPGRWVGLFLEIGGFDPESKAFLEGDERIHVDGGTHPALYGTGVEDFFSGGFYYRILNRDSVPFRRALHGMTYELVDTDGPAMGMYRLMITDAPVFGARLIVGLEAGPLNQTPVRMRAVSFFFRRSTPPMRRRDVLDVGDPASRSDHLYTTNGNLGCSPLDAFFEDEPPTRLVAESCSRGESSASFTLRGVRPEQTMVLRRRFDAAGGDQRASVSIAGLPVGGLGYEDSNPHRRWRERDLPLGVWSGAGNELPLSVEVPPGSTRFSEAVWELWAGYPPGTCDATLDGVCDAGDAAELVRLVDLGGEVGGLLVVLAAVFD
jgi:hypothetical protein